MARILLGRVLLSMMLMGGSSEVYAEAWTTIGPQLSFQPLSTADGSSEGSSTGAAVASNRAKTLFASLPPSETGIDFTNRLDWHHPQGLLFDTGFACGGKQVLGVNLQGRFKKCLSRQFATLPRK